MRDRRGTRRRGRGAGGDELVSQDERALVRQELVADEEAEVEQRAAEREVGDDEDRHGERGIGAQFRGPAEMHRARKQPVGCREGQRLAAGVDPGEFRRLAQHEHIGDEDAEVQGRERDRCTAHECAGERDRSDQVERGVLRERDLRRAEHDGRQTQHEQRCRLGHPPVVGE